MASKDSDFEKYKAALYRRHLRDLVEQTVKQWK